VKTPEKPESTPPPEEEAAPMSGSSELEDVEAADIDERPAELEPFDRLVQRSRRLSPERVKAVVESLLFVTDKPVSVDQLHDATGLERPRLLEALTALAKEREEAQGGTLLVEVAGGWQIRTHPESSDYVRRLLRLRPHRLTRAALETLAIVAYRQPVTRPEIEDVRGVDSGAVLKALLERRLLKILGKKEEVGRPLLYGTTREFLEFFALKDLSGLPTLREFQELSEEHRSLVDPAGPANAEGMIDELSDPLFEQTLEEAAPGAEEAMEALEQAMEEAEARTRAAAVSLGSASSPAPRDGEDPPP
jgi:segregation and condensation protein B